jgi:hypothetical protein
MADNERRSKPELESLEGRTVPSAAIPGAAVTPAALVHGAKYLFLHGTAHGKTHQTMLNPDVGVALALHGHGIVSPLGAVAVSGTLHGTGFIATGTPEGTITLSNARGSVTLKLVGPSEPGFTPPPSGTYQFSMVKGMGAYAKDLADGTIDLTLTGDTFSMTFHGAPNRF